MHHPHEESNGILAKVPGHCCADAMRLLPDPTTAEDRPYIVEIDAEHMGRVRLHLRRQKAKHHKHSHWYWCAYCAEPVSGTPYSK